MYTLYFFSFVCVYCTCTWRRKNLCFLRKSYTPSCSLNKVIPKVICFKVLCNCQLLITHECVPACECLNFFLPLNCRHDQNFAEKSFVVPFSQIVKMFPVRSWCTYFFAKVNRTITFF